MGRSPANSARVAGLERWTVQDRKKQLTSCDAVIMLAIDVPTQAPCFRIEASPLESSGHSQSIPSLVSSELFALRFERHNCHGRTHLMSIHLIAPGGFRFGRRLQMFATNANLGAAELAAAKRLGCQRATDQSPQRPLVDDFMHGVTHIRTVTCNWFLTGRAERWQRLRT